MSLYVLPGNRQIQIKKRTVEPYGLVAKANVWHLVCAVEGALHAYRVSDILDAKLGEHFHDPTILSWRLTGKPGAPILKRAGRIILSRCASRPTLSPGCRIILANLSAS